VQVKLARTRIAAMCAIAPFAGFTSYYTRNGPNPALKAHIRSL
jgi:hypothetical protein